LLFFIALIASAVCHVRWAGIAIDVTVFKDQSKKSTTGTTPAFSTSSGNQLLLAFVAADAASGANTTVSAISGGGLQWSLVQRTNVQRGTAEIWRAFANNPLTSVAVTATLSRSVNSSITVMSFTGVDTTGAGGSGAIGATVMANALSGAPTASLVTTRDGSLVLGVGNDFDNALARTLGPSQTLVHQYLAPVGDTYWVQRQTNTTSASGTSVTINDTAPTSDRYNLALVEVLAAHPAGGTTFTISGSITPSAQRKRRDSCTVTGRSDARECARRLQRKLQLRWALQRYLFVDAEQNGFHVLSSHPNGGRQWCERRCSIVHGDGGPSHAARA
jgi:hypothetical protein